MYVQKGEKCTYTVIWNALNVTFVHLEITHEGPTLTLYSKRYGSWMTFTFIPASAEGVDADILASWIKKCQKRKEKMKVKSTKAKSCLSPSNAETNPIVT